MIQNETDGRISYTVVRSGRRTLAIQVKRDGQVVVRCPLHVADKDIRDFVELHKEWICRHSLEARERKREQVSYTPAQVASYRSKARRVLTDKTKLWAERMGVDYGRITIREQATRWGSCSAKGSLNYNWKLILVPEELLEYVVVHELAHRKEMNHSQAFWNIVERELPDYRQRREALKNYEDKINS